MVAREQVIEYSSGQLARIAARGLANPLKLTATELRALCGSVLTQARNKQNVGVRMTRPVYGAKNWKTEAV